MKKYFFSIKTFIGFATVILFVLNIQTIQAQNLYLKGETQLENGRVIHVGIDTTQSDPNARHWIRWVIRQTS